MRNALNRIAHARSGPVGLAGNVVELVYYYMPRHAPPPVRLCWRGLRVAAIGLCAAPRRKWSALTRNGGDAEVYGMR